MRGGFGHGADDEAAGFVSRQRLLQPFPQLGALDLVLDALRDADVRLLRQVDEKAPGDADLGRKPRSLGADRILDHLHQDVLTFREQPLDRLRFLCAMPVAPDVGDVQEGGPVEADVDEGRLHPGQDARDAPEVDVAHQPAAARTLDVQFLHHTLLHDRDARFLGRDVDEDLFRHRTSKPKCCINSTISNSGRPMTPE